MAESETVKKAPAKKAAAKKPKASKQEAVIFRSSQQEPLEFAVHKYRARRCTKPGYIEWEVPAEEADIFATHPHVTRGRIVRVEG